MLFYIRIIIVAMLLALSSCKKLVEVDPPVTGMLGSETFNNDEASIAAMTGIFVNQAGFNTGLPFVSRFSGLSADEFVLWSGISTESREYTHYTNALSAPMNGVTGFGSEFWIYSYRNIYSLNVILEGVKASSMLSPAVKRQLMGEALFMRAFFYFYLVNLYGDVVLTETTDYQVNRLMPRVAQQLVYEKIIADLKEAQELLSEVYVDKTLIKPSMERVRPVKGAATALLARVYLYKKEWANAETQASSVIEQSGDFQLLPLNEVFKANSKEAIFQLQTVNLNKNTEDGALFVMKTATSSAQHPIQLSKFLLNAFEPGDKRRVKGNWVNDTIAGTGISYYPFKYKQGLNSVPGQEHIMVLRLAEQYLIRAEARFMQQKFQEGIDDINYVRLKHGGFNTVLHPPTGHEAAMNIMANERQVELFSEWGHRWFDLKRWNKIDEVMQVVTPLKNNGQPWQSFQQLYPLPFTDIQRNPNLIQNGGYDN